MKNLTTWYLVITTVVVAFVGCGQSHHLAIRTFTGSDGRMLSIEEYEHDGTRCLIFRQDEDRFAASCDWQHK